MSKSAKILNHLCLDFSSIKAIKQLANLDTLTKFEFLSNLTRGVADKIEKRNENETLLGRDPNQFGSGKKWYTHESEVDMVGSSLTELFPFWFNSFLLERSLKFM